MNQPLFIVIAVHNRKKITLKCLDQLRAQTFQNFKVIIVDDGSTDGTYEEISARYPETFLIKGTGDWWWTRSVNEGIKAGLEQNAQHILLLNDDTIFDTNYLETLMAETNTNPDTIIGSLNLTLESPHRVYFSGTSGFNKFTFKHHRYNKTMSPYDPEKFTGTRNSYYLPARGMLVPTSTFRKIGLFDEVNLPQYLSDVDFTMRAVKSGIKCIISYKVILYTPVNSTGAGDFYKKEPLRKFFKSFTNPYSKRHLGVSYRFVKKHSPRLLTPFCYMMYQTRILGAFVRSRI